MSLAAGDGLGPYEIQSAIGSGAMGDVYRAKDTRLDRTVAIKVCKEQFSARFEREARAVASLNHPQICQIRAPWCWIATRSPGRIRRATSSCDRASSATCSASRFTEPSCVPQVLRSFVFDKASGCR